MKRISSEIFGCRGNGEIRFYQLLSVFVFVNYFPEEKISYAEKLSRSYGKPKCYQNEQKYHKQ